MPHGSGRGASHPAPLQAILVNAVHLASARSEDSVLTPPVPMDASDVPEMDAPASADSTSASGIPLASPPPQPPEPMQPIYRTAAELHLKPIPLTPIDLAEFARIYPGARARFSVLIDEKGKIDAINVREGSHPALAEAFRSFLGKARFVPGRIAAQPVKSELMIEIALPELRPSTAPQGGSTATLRLQ